jgi:hypothetical protein
MTSEGDNAGKYMLANFDDNVSLPFHSPLALDEDEDYTGLQSD